MTSVALGATARSRASVYRNSPPDAKVGLGPVSRPWRCGMRSRSVLALALLACAWLSAPATAQ
ncbi:hypothetical protein, partial [Rhodoplanes roseus]|uniref:hypothetical protein n=1 Tax=Rhodoplanes roseus TaxID=29409 RepID=UPI001AECA506